MKNCNELIRRDIDVPSIENELEGESCITIRMLNRRDLM